MWDNAKGKHRSLSYGGSEGTFTPTPLLGGESSAFGGDGHSVGGDGGAVGGESANLAKVQHSGARTRYLSRPPRTLVKRQVSCEFGENPNWFIYTPASSFYIPIMLI